MCVCVCILHVSRLLPYAREAARRDGGDVALTAYLSPLCSRMHARSASSSNGTATRRQCDDRDSCDDGPACCFAAVPLSEGLIDSGTNKAVYITAELCALRRVHGHVHVCA